MIEIERHIEILLLNNDCVIVPGLGGFTAHHVEARYDDADGMYLPPLRTLGFNPQLKLNDSLLAQSYVEAYDISYPEALRKIESEVEEMKQRIDNEGCYEMDDIGVLETNGDGNIEFTPCEAGILTPSLYGLSSFEMQPLAVEEEEAKAPVQPITGKGVATPVTTTVFDRPIEESDEEKNTEDEEKTICIKVSLLRNAGIAAAAVIAFLLVFTPVTHSGLQNVTIGDFNGTTFFSKLMPKDSQFNRIDIDAVRNATKKTATTKTVKSQTADIIKPTRQKAQTDTFCIVLASRIPRKNAEEYVGQLHRKGFDKAYAYVNNRMVRVIYGNYASENEAYNELQKIRSNKDFEQAWILKKEKKRLKKQDFKGEKSKMPEM